MCNFDTYNLTKDDDTIGPNYMELGLAVLTLAEIHTEFTVETIHMLTMLAYNVYLERESDDKMPMYMAAYDVLCMTDKISHEINMEHSDLIVNKLSVVLLNTLTGLMIGKEENRLAGMNFAIGIDDFELENLAVMCYGDIVYYHKDS